MDKNFQNNKECAILKEKSQECADMNIRLRQREMVKTLFSDIRYNPKKYLFIHYSSESFENNQGVPRILTVKISNAEGNDIKTFSVLHEAIIRKIGEDKIAENIDELEKAMLDKLLMYVISLNPQYQIFLHWNMKDSSYGFEAIALRYQVLNGKADFNVFDKFAKINLSDELQKLYGEKYIGKPRIQCLIGKNKLEKPAMQKKDEKLLSEGKYAKLQNSFNARYESLLKIINLTLDGRLKTNHNIIDRYGFNPAGIFEAIKDDWKLAFVAAVFWLFIAIIFEKFFLS